MRHLSDQWEAGRSTLELDEEPSGGAWSVEFVGAESSRRTVLEQDGVAIVGSRPGADLVICDPAVSGRHARLHASDGGLEVRDLGSRNGVFVGGARVERAVLRSGSSFVVGRTRLLVRRGTAPLAKAPCPLIPGLVGTSAPMRRLAEEVERVARLDAPVMIVGESGTGKDVVARAIHSLSGRAGRYVALNAGALPESLADSELFGHRRGAFTGALQAHEGAFEQADRGTLFLDEVGDLSPAVQVKLLRAVEQGEIRKLGATGVTRVQARVVTATWAPLLQRIDEGRFRADLYHRIATFVISIPPLRQRRGDIPALCEAQLASREAQLGKKQLAPAALERLARYAFPGNVRELFSVVYRAAALCPNFEISLADVEAALSCGAGDASTRGAPDARHILAAHGGNVSAAARSARVARSTFRSWLKRPIEVGADFGGPSTARDS